MAGGVVETRAGKDEPTSILGIIEGNGFEME
jgi:hypothetical protein